MAGFHKILAPSYGCRHSIPDGRVEEWSDSGDVSVRNIVGRAHLLRVAKDAVPDQYRLERDLLFGRQDGVYLLDILHENRYIMSAVALSYNRKRERLYLLEGFIL